MLYSHVALRTLQLILSLVIIGLYSPDLANATSTSSTVPAAWIVAIITAVLSALTCILHGFLTISFYLTCSWDVILAVVWAAITGTFGVMFADNSQHGEVKQDLAAFTTSRQRMKAAVWLNLTLMVLWLMSALLGCGGCCVDRKVVKKKSIAEHSQEHDKMEGMDFDVDDCPPRYSFEKTIEAV